jgi:hypothetical protein
MAARTADSAFFPSLSPHRTDSDKPAESSSPTPVLDNPLGAFRGLGFALVLEVLFAIIGMGFWEILRRLF